MPPAFLYSFEDDADIDDEIAHSVTGLRSRLGVMIVILVLSFFGVTFPALSKRVPFLKIPRIVFFLGKHFGTGVILATTFCHLLPDAFEHLQSSRVQKQYHQLGDWTGSIILGSLLLIFIVEYASTSYVEHLHEAPSTPPARSPFPSRRGSSTVRDPSNSSTPKIQTEITPLLPQMSYRRSIARFMTPVYFSALINSPRLTSVPTHAAHNEYFVRPRGCEGLCRDQDHCECELPQTAAPSESAVDDEDIEVESPDVHTKVSTRRQVVGILVLQSGIMLHSLVIGLTLSITSGADFTSLVSAISFHQVFEGLSLGIRISALPKQGRRSITYLKLVLYVLFAVTTPTGILVGLLAFTAGSGSSTDSVQMDAVQGILSAISAGMLIYAATVEMLAGDFVFGKLGSGHGHGHVHGHVHDHEALLSREQQVVQNDLEHRRWQEHVPRDAHGNHDGGQGRSPSRSRSRSRKLSVHHDHHDFEGEGGVKRQIQAVFALLLGVLCMGMLSFIE